MENVTIKNKETSELTGNKITIDNRNRICITGISKMLSSNDTNISMLVKNTKLVVAGKDLHIEKLDVDCGIMEATGTIDSVKYAGGDGLIKRIFK